MTRMRVSKYEQKMTERSILLYRVSLISIRSYSESVINGWQELPRFSPLCARYNNHGWISPEVFQIATAVICQSLRTYYLLVSLSSDCWPIELFPGKFLGTKIFNFYALSVPPAIHRQTPPELCLWTAEASSISRSNADFCLRSTCTSFSMDCIDSSTFCNSVIWAWISPIPEKRAQHIINSAG